MPGAGRGRWGEFHQQKIPSLRVKEFQAVDDTQKRLLNQGRVNAAEVFLKA